MNRTKRDIAYLREYINFAADLPATAAECLHKGLVEAHSTKEFSSVAHLQLALHAEMVMCLESFGAMLRAFSLWDKPEGILGALAHYGPGDILKFIKKLNTSNDSLRLLCFPEKDVLLAQGFCRQDGYSSEGFREMVAEDCRMYLSENIRGAYNKIKHGGMCIRHPGKLNLPNGKTLKTKDVFLITDVAKDGAIESASFRVYGGKGIAMADKYLNNVRQITSESKLLANFVARCLEYDIMLPSQQQD